MKKVQKIFKNIEVLNIVSYVNQMSKQTTDALPLKFRWYLKKNVDTLLPIAATYETFRNEQIKKLRDNWFNDTYSEEYIDEKTKEPMRKIKDEYLDRYQKEAAGLNQKLSEIANEENDVEIVVVDFDELIGNLPDNSAISFDDLVMLGFMDLDTNLKK